MNLSQINNVILRLGFFWGQSTFHQGSLDAVTHIEKVLTELEDWDARHPATTVDAEMQNLERIEFIRIEEMGRLKANSDTCGTENGSAAKDHKVTRRRRRGDQ